jgi:hypothetical protein
MNVVTKLTAWLWYGSMVLQPVLIILCVWRGTHKKNPWFPRYLALDFSASVFLLFVHNYSEYVASFYLLAVITAFSKIGILADLVSQVFGPYRDLPRWTMQRLLLWMLATMAASSVLIFMGRASNLDSAMNFLRTADSMIASAVLCGFWLMVVYARKLGLYWRSHAAGITVGFLFYGSVQTASKLVLFKAHLAAAVWVRNVSQLSYLVALCIWLGFLMIPEPAQRVTREDAEMALAIVRSSEEKLNAIAGRKKPNGTAMVEIKREYMV